MKITIVSPYHGGSHQAWAEGYQRHSGFEVSLLTMPARFWKWRMHGGAVTLARRFLENGRSPDIFLVTDMLDLTTFLALTRSVSAGAPVVLYMHENQLTYPQQDNPSTEPKSRHLSVRDQHYAFINFASMLAANVVAFNSQYHLDSWFAALPAFLKHFPEYNELNAIGRLKKKSLVLPIGIDLARLQPAPATAEKPDDPPLILWNQRWEYDKNPEAFWAAITAVSQAGIPFRLALCGQQYGKRPLALKQALHTFADHIIHCGLADADTYRRLLWQADIVISTAYHEFFGISILEAIYCHTWPLLPNRLSYPELLPQAFHSQCLYEDDDDFVNKLIEMLRYPAHQSNQTLELRTAVSLYDWSHLAPRYDQLLKNTLA
jgi:glycosyltransferase involved in cell wall biosynthesis